MAMTRTKKILLNILSLVLFVAVFYFLGKEFIRNWEHIKYFQFEFNILMLVAASAIYAGVYVLFALGWFLILRYLHCSVPFYETLLYFIITQPAKYVPGKIWTGVARMKFCKPHGVPNSLTLLSTGTESILEIFAGVYVSIIALIQTNAFRHISWPIVIVLSVIGIIILCPPVFYFIVNLYFKIVKQTPIEAGRRVSFIKLLSLQIIYIVAIAGLGFSSFLFLQSFSPVSYSYAPFLIGVGALSYWVGIVALFTPNGFGVREGVWYMGLKTIVAPHISMVYAFVSRIWLIVAESVLLFIALPLLWIHRRKEKHASTENIIRGV